jgi:hypothetical protein
MWYNQLKDFLVYKGYSNNDCPCVFIHKSSTGFYIISVYVHDLNIIGTELEINKVQDHFKMEFGIKNLGKTIFLRFTIGAPSYAHSRTPIGLWLVNIREIQYE